MRDALGDEFDGVWREGAALDVDDAVAYTSRARGERKRPSAGWDSLTPTEERVVALVAEGLTNSQIAERMFIAAAPSRSTSRTSSPSSACRPAPNSRPR